MAKVVLHIGAHKTGTSYLQGLFYRNHGALAAAGLHYPPIGPNEAHHALASAWIMNPDIPDRFFGAGGPDAFWQNKIIKPYADAPGTVFLSAENFSRFLPQKVDMAALAERLAPFESIRILYTMRRQVDLVSSLWTQIAKMRAAPTLRAYVERAYTECLGRGIPLDHNAVYDHLLTGFSPEQITLLDYSQLAAAPGGMAQVFLDLMGIDLRADSLASPPETVANISPDPLSLFAATQITGREPPPDALIETIRAIVHPDRRQPATLLARHEYIRVHRRFVPLNRLLVRRVQTVQPGFSFDDAEPPETMFYRDDLTAQHWMQIAAAVYNMPKAGVTLSQARRLLHRATRR